METKMLDEIDTQLLNLLLDDSRMSLKNLGHKVALSSPSVAERLRRLQERGVIRSFTLDIDPQALGYTLQAIVRIRPLPGMLHVVQKLIEDIAEVTQCSKVTGDDCFIAHLSLRSIGQLDGILDKITDKAETNTSIVKSQTVRRRPPPLKTA
jgi:Lrp/AsnC family transcriptional regulator, leucine-responsive regulatory protein